MTTLEQSLAEKNTRGFQQATVKFREQAESLLKISPTDWQLEPLIDRTLEWTRSAAQQGSETADRLFWEQDRLDRDWKLMLNRFSGAYVVALSGPAEKWRDAALLSILACISSVLLLVLQRTYRRRIHERAAVETALRESETRYRSLFENVWEGVYQAQAGGGLLSGNPGFARLLGFSADKDLREVNLVRDCALPEETEQRLRSLLESEGEFQNEELKLRRQDGTIFLALASARAVKNALGEMVRYEGTLVDITQRKEAEHAALVYTRELEESRRKLEQQARQLLEQSFELAEARDKALQGSRRKSIFMANLSHELRTPLNGVVGMAQLLLDTELNPQQREFAEMVGRSAEALLSSLNDIVEYAKAETGEIELARNPFSLRGLLAGMIEETAGMAEAKGLEMTCLVRREVPDAVLGDATRLKQVLLHLVRNSVEFTPTGEVAIAVNLVRELPANVVLRIQVEDTGAGIPPESFVRLFEPFTRGVAASSRVHEGPGLGLAISKLLIEKMGGQIGVESEPGQGSLFWVQVPLEKQAGAADHERAPTGLAHRSVLVVDDVASARGVTAELLSGWGMRCATAADSDAALIALRNAAKEGRAFEVVLADYDMPGCSGLELAEQIGEEPGLSPSVILVTPFSERHWRDEPLLESIHALVSKPIREQELQKALLACLGPPANSRSSTASDLVRMGQHVLTAAELAQQAATPGSTPDEAEETSVRRVILIAEDNLVNQKVAVRLVEKMGYEARVVINGEEALQSMQHRACDLVLMDCQMPVMDGFECTAKIRALPEPLRSTPIIAMTANAMYGDRERCLKAGMDDYISKPVGYDELRGLIERWLSRALAHQG